MVCDASYARHLLVLGGHSRLYLSILLFVVCVAFSETEEQLMPTVIRIRAKPSKTALKGEMVVSFIFEPEAFMQRIISLIAKQTIPNEANMYFHY